MVLENIKLLLESVSGLFPKYLFLAGSLQAFGLLTSLLSNHPYILFPGNVLSMPGFRKNVNLLILSEKGLWQFRNYDCYLLTSDVIISDVNNFQGEWSMIWLTYSD